jgi:hypothetical protein
LVLLRSVIKFELFNRSSPLSKKVVGKCLVRFSCAASKIIQNISKQLKLAEKSMKKVIL